MDKYILELLDKEIANSKKRHIRLINIVGGFVYIVGCGLLWYFYDWKLPLIISILVWGNNMERKK